MRVYSCFVDNMNFNRCFVSDDILQFVVSDVFNVVRIMKSFMFYE